MRIFISICCFIVLNSACQQKKEGIQAWYGKWKGDKWLIGGQTVTGFDASIINFEFKADSTYVAHMGSQVEEGHFNLRNNCFNAISKQGVPKKCPIIHISQDTMVWMMDSVEQQGNLYLVRVK